MTPRAADVPLGFLNLATPRRRVLRVAGLRKGGSLAPATGRRMVSLVTFPVDPYGCHPSMRRFAGVRLFG